MESQCLGATRATAGVGKGGDGAGSDNHNKARSESFFKSGQGSCMGRIPAIAGTTDPGYKGLRDVPIQNISIINVRGMK
jgi:hypothetical protein